ncbi:hypothetical protein KAFR_0H00450 [Kazachstania africana CBS 2517]|uniref:Uncharacterized protein n=1 Tax=Kazachstania africana (strain ATCC 22294 / BCRC 22015 / CBS 2517 / CECT 1963 / NBRC 1671 / NRRL Y-8276) TaxID=1071382 RepID=H2AYP8_KAZAF|nr:hypothetical protein KAFR_0H00450 [Kazachstania africana CBS 2517]CCF59454.1 hypothetical protein KAFR_0H00450 [Kazachstania africana CBS 2517]
MSTKSVGLLLIHPAITTTPEVVEKIRNDSDNINFVHQFLVNKVNDGTIKLDDSKYDFIHYLTPEAPDQIKFPKKLISVLGNALKTSGKLYGLSDVYKLDALINGFEVFNNDGEYYWLKNATEPAKAVSLKSKERTGQPVSLLPKFKRKDIKKSKVHTAIPSLDDSDSDEIGEKLKTFSISSLMEETSDDESIDEDELLDGEDIKNITMITCGKSKTKKKKACKDCSCGIKEEEEEEIDAIRSRQAQVIKFTEDELTEIDFTIEGKKVGGCGSCSLGDAFRCTGCPYLGLPAFKPGETINLNSISDDL